MISLGFHITDECTAHCAHCAYHCGPHAKGVMSEESKRWVHDVECKLVCISGGEPTLYPRVVAQISREASKKEVPVWLFTSGFWGGTSAGEKMVSTFKDEGVTRLCLSADQFHEEFIPLERVRCAISTAGEAGLEVVVDVRMLDGEGSKNCLERIRFKGEVWRGEPRCVGRAAETLVAHYTKRGLECLGPWVGGTWEDPDGMDVDACGEVTLCPGISIGNVKQRLLKDILLAYNPRDHPIIGELVRGGPEGLAELARRKGYGMREDYVSGCHLCYDVRKFLRPYYGELAPRICYEEVSDPIL